MVPFKESASDFPCFLLGRLFLKREIFILINNGLLFIKRVFID